MSPGECDTGDQTHTGWSGWRLDCLCVNTEGHTLPASLPETHGHLLLHVVRRQNAGCFNSWAQALPKDLKSRIANVYWINLLTLFFASFSYERDWLFQKVYPCKWVGQWGERRWADFVIAQLCLSVQARRLKSHFGESLCIASDDNGRKLGCVCVSACACFHCIMCFQWHPGWCAVVFSSHCNSDSKTVCLIVLWSFHVLHKAGKLGQGNGCFVLCTLRIGTL